MRRSVDFILSGNSQCVSLFASRLSSRPQEIQQIHAKLCHDEIHVPVGYVRLL